MPHGQHHPQWFFLSSVSGSAMFMPRVDRSPVLPGRSLNEHTALRRNLFAELIRQFHPRTLPDFHHTFDDALTAFVITSIGPSEKSVESSLQYWLTFLKFIVQKLDLHMDVPHLCEDDKEERRRLWWATYIIDRHSSLSFNSRPLITDHECHQLPTPRSDSIWDQTGSLTAAKDDMNYGTDILKILGEILEYHFLCGSATFNQSADYLLSVRRNIEGNLGLWFISFQSLVEPDFAKLAEVQGEAPALRDEPQIAYYALHLYHCMHILLYGPMDIVVMYEDLKWQASSEFVAACEHANACAKSCFIFLILAQKLGRQSDDLIISNCAINLEVLDKFILTTNMDYQHDFAKLLRKVLSDLIQHPTSKEPELEEAAQSSLDPEMLRYRWIPGFKGLVPNPDLVE
uniref:Xylanolytic transcriptional activator xlnR n=1 Tax=Talaromyces marneffei PM1 TaxID=1077442 RepID=A0A093V8Y3_TALMA